ncbi:MULTISPECIES: hypothetical protein [unclassified Rhodococcus (in: high G+C Gram-positive bacteria)]|uniref:hypothetical protein n=1 Tax=unclassified Rhodococcus (in: high G+C Gram-positive bacteria) TaxID=192944 RepID=UPI0012F48CE6|nr:MULTISPECIES: hypothetical protein [unclassified Rhodococcus (in: high G+C Gram-positive bacteria)]
MAISSISGRAGAPASVINPMTVTTPAAHVAPSRSAIVRRVRGGGVVRRVIGRSQGEPPPISTAAITADTRMSVWTVMAAAIPPEAARMTAVIHQIMR